jgi:glycosyltransferase involved in cell wall biosynthesis
MAAPAEKTLVIISPGFPSDEGDSTCLPAQQNFIKAVNRNFPLLKIKIIALQYPYRKDRYTWFGNTVISLNGKSFSLFKRPLLWIKTYLRLREFEKQNNVCGVLSFWCQETALIGRLFARRNKLLHKIWIKGQDARRRNFFVRWIRPTGDELVALSDFLASEFNRNHHILPAHTIPNGIDINLYKLFEGRKDIDILGVGSLIPLKQFTLFIQVVSRLVKSKPDLMAMLAGDGNERKKIEELIESNGLRKNITLTGELPHGDVIELMQRSRILLHPSSYEGYSTVCLEALYAGCHVVSFVAAEKEPVRHWHIVDNVNEMTFRCGELLQDSRTSERVLVHDMNDTARKMVHQFFIDS